MPYSNPILGGTALVRPAIKSPNFVAGSTGWSVNQDGSAQFNDIALTGGSLIITGSGQGAFVYSGTPALGNLIVSMASAAGTDAYGNTYPEGFGLTDGQIPGGLINAGSIDASKVSFVATDIGGIRTTVSSTPPLTPNVGDIWIDSSNGNLLKRWSGSAWDATPFDTGAIADGAITSNLIAANAIVAGQIAAGAIDGQTLNAVNINGTNISGADFIVSGTNGGIFIYSSGGTITQTFTTSTTWTAPAGVTSVKVECWGGGGGGGGADAADSTYKEGGCGGGGGEYAAEPAVVVTPGTGYSVVVGAAGFGGPPLSLGPGNDGKGGPGGNTTFNGTTVVAHGGGGGQTISGNIGAGGTGSTNTFHHNGGNGGSSPVSSGPATAGGGGGGSGGSAGNGNTGLDGSGTTGGAGAAAVTSGGPGGNAGNSAVDGSAPSTGPGGGGGGAGGVGGATEKGGAGAAGQVRLTYTSSTPQLIAAIAGADTVDPVSGVALTAGLNVLGPLASDALTSFAVTGDANSRLQILASGDLHWGDGTNTQDTVLYRESAGLLASSSITADISGTAETWHQAALQNGWTVPAGNTPVAYRLVASPPNTVQVTGLCTPGNKTNGTLLFTLPPGYRPLNAVQLPVVATNTTTDPAMAHCNVATTGAVTIFNASTTGFIAFNTMFPLDI